MFSTQLSWSAASEWTFYGGWIRSNEHYCLYDGTRGSTPPHADRHVETGRRCVCSCRGAKHGAGDSLRKWSLDSF